MTPTRPGGGATRIPSDFRPPDLAPTADGLRAHFARRPPAQTPMRNFHHEARVSPETVATAKPSAVLIPFVERAEGLSLLLTRRHHSISAPGQLCFPGGRADPGDRDRVATALRETREETGLAPDAVSVLGTLGHYHSHSGHDIVPAVGLVRPPLDLVPSPNEVEEIVELPATVAFRADSYQLLRHHSASPRAHFVLDHDGVQVTGLTVCLLMNLYVDLAHGPGAPAETTPRVG